MCTLVFILPYLPSFSIHYYMFYHVYSSGGTIHVRIRVKTSQSARATHDRLAAIRCRKIPNRGITLRGMDGRH